MYLTENTEFIIETVNSNQNITKPLNYEAFDEMILDIMENESEGDVKFTVLQDETWPMKDALSFNDSQYDAFKLSLSHEFAVVQGPPGTGKTYLGIKVAKTLFENLKTVEGCLMLVICYTNHALDQFLEALLDVTDSMVRIGGQSRNPAMDEINLTKLRRNISLNCNSQRSFFDQKIELKETITQFQKSLVELDVLLNGVVKEKVIIDDVNEVQYLRDFYMNAGLGQGYDALFFWLFEHRDQFRNDVGYLLEDNAGDNAMANHEKESRRRTGVMLDDHEINNAGNKAYRDQIASFSVETANSQIKQLVAQFRKTQDEQLKQNIIMQLQTLDSYKTLFNVSNLPRGQAKVPHYYVYKNKAAYVK